MNDNPAVILASGSKIRASILNAHGVRFQVVKPGVDESVIKIQAQQDGAGLEDIALRLAEAKCMAVAAHHGGLVIGADQILEFDGKPYDKPTSMAEARTRLMEMQGRSHTLINGAVVARDGQVIWRHVERPRLVMRGMTAGEIDAYLSAAGDDILSSVGAYQVEALGARLFDRIEGDYFAVLGLAVFPLFALLREEGALAF